MKGTLITLIIIFNATILLSQSITPKRDFRGAWVATVTNLDWPSSRNLTTAAQQEELISLFNELERININAVIFQIRTECDALYDSTLRTLVLLVNRCTRESPKSLLRSVRICN